MILGFLSFQQVIVATGDIMENVVRLVAVESSFAVEDARQTVFI